jgi:hypothetical protein
MTKTVYIETSIPSYLTARPSRDIRAAAWQQITAQWWDEARAGYICAGAGYSCPEICTPVELLPEGQSDV